MVRARKESYTLATASIIAKMKRDRVMVYVLLRQTRQLRDTIRKNQDNYSPAMLELLYERYYTYCTISRIARRILYEYEDWNF